MHCPLFKSIVVLTGFLLIPLSGTANADMSVNGFFPANYAKSGLFEGAKESAEVKNTEAVAVNATASTYNKPPARKARKIRMYPGRFVKTTRGNSRSKVSSSEWDVGSTLSD